MKVRYFLLLMAAGLVRSPVMAQGASTTPRSVVAPTVPAKPTQLADYLVFDANSKEYVATNGENTARFTFNLTNISAGVVTIESVQTSCHCTTAHLPPMPWQLAPGTNSEINVTVDIAGKTGIIFKTVRVNTDKGNGQLLVKVTVLARPGMGSREMNVKIAEGNRQAVFSGDCASCHVARGEGRMGRELFAADCGICHEAEHRASMVPDLRHLNHEDNRELWEVWIRYGKPGSMMPAFAKSDGGPLSEEQIRSLVSYLAEIMAAPPVSQPK